jgi:hypothetical protein
MSFADGGNRFSSWNGRFFATSWLAMDNCQIDNADQIEMGAVAGARCFKGDPRPPRLVRPDVQW